MSASRAGRLWTWLRRLRWPKCDWCGEKMPPVERHRRYGNFLCDPCTERAKTVEVGLVDYIG